jgi:hypothetical protein
VPKIGIFGPLRIPTEQLDLLAWCNPILRRGAPRNQTFNVEKEKPIVKRILSLLFLCLAVMLGLSLTAVANDSTLYLGDPTSTITNGQYTGPYNGTINGTPTLLVCDDFLHTVYFDSSEQVTIASTTNPVGTRFPGPNSGSPDPLIQGLNQTQAFNLVTYFATQILANPGGGGPAGVDSWAIWAIFDNGLNGSQPSNTQAVVDAAIAAGYDNTYNGSLPLYVVDPNVNGGYGQEFIGESPEPLSMALMGTFLTLAGLGLGRKKLFA